ncbi:MAG: serine/threonine-protein kinase, partial [Myxococcota bacterium]
MSSTEPKKEPAPTLQGRYRVVRTLEATDLGATFLGYDLRLHRWRTIDVPADPAAGQRLVREAELLARLEHPAVERVIDMGEDGAISFVVRDRLHGSAAQFMPMTPILAATVVLRVADGLVHAHTRGILHGNVRPSVVRFAEEGGPVLVGFGRVARLDVNTSGRSAEPWAHLAPEMRRSWSPDPRTEVYSLGAMLYTLLAGRHQADLFYAEAYDGLMAPVPGALRPVVFRACAYDPAERLQDVESFRSLLTSRLDQLGALGEVPWRPELLPDRPPDHVVPDAQLQILIQLLGRRSPTAEARPVGPHEGSSTIDREAFLGPEGDGLRGLPYQMPRLERKDPGFRDPFEEVDARDLPEYVDLAGSPSLQRRRPPPFVVDHTGSSEANTPVPARRKMRQGPVIGPVLGAVIGLMALSAVGFAAALAVVAWLATAGIRADARFVEAVESERTAAELLAATSPDRTALEEAWFRFDDDPSAD